MVKIVIFIGGICATFALYFLYGNWNRQKGLDQEIKTESMTRESPPEILPEVSPVPVPEFKKSRQVLATSLQLDQVFAIKHYPGMEQGKLDWEYIDTFKPVKGGYEVEVEAKDGAPVVMDDILVFGAKFPRDGKGGRYTMERPKLWNDGIVSYEIQVGQKVASAILEAIAHFHEVTDIKFVQRTDEEDYVVFGKGQEHCLSALGRQGGMQAILLSERCGKGEILHEMMHTLGFIHEHARPMRDEFVVVFWDNMEQKFWPQFKKIPKDHIHVLDVEFDFNSVMMYGPDYFSQGNYATMTRIDGSLYQVNRSELSPLDLEKIQLLYGDQ